MKDIGKVFLLAILFCFLFATSACSSKQNSVAGQPATAGTPAASSQTDNSSQTGAQPDNKTDQDKSGSQPAASQPKENPGDKSQPGGVDKPGLTDQVKPESKSGVPAKALVFTYNADCCESTRQFFDMHSDSVKALENKYGDRVKFTWYDVALKDDAYQKEMLEVAKKVGVQNIPAFVVLDMSGNVLTSQIGQLKMDEVNKIFEGLSR